MRSSISAQSCASTPPAPEVVVLAGEQGPGLQCVEVRLEPVQLAGDLRLEGLVALLPGQLGQGGHVVDAGLQALVEPQVVLQLGELPLQPLGGVGVVPQVRPAELCLQLGPARTELVDPEVDRRLRQAAAERLQAR
jgi:hypothetical protein